MNRRVAASGWYDMIASSIRDNFVQFRHNLIWTKLAIDDL